MLLAEACSCCLSTYPASASGCGGPQALRRPTHHAPVVASPPPSPPVSAPPPAPTPTALPGPRPPTPPPPARPFPAAPPQEARRDPRIKAVYDLPFGLQAVNERYILPYRLALHRAVRACVRACKSSRKAVAGGASRRACCSWCRALCLEHCRCDDVIVPACVCCQANTTTSQPTCLGHLPCGGSLLHTRMLGFECFENQPSNGIPFHRCSCGASTAAYAAA